MTRTTLYFAYGSNLDPGGMELRCPAAVVVGRARLHDWRLTFRGVADVEEAEGEIVEGLLWACTDECIQSLDRYEGVSGGFYRKVQLEVDYDGEPTEALVYVMTPTRYDNASMPSTSYLKTIVRGYVRYGLPLPALRAALRHCSDRCEEKGVREWEHDGRKRMRPAGWKPERRAPKKRPRRKRPKVRPTSAPVLSHRILNVTEEQASAMGISPATLADLKLAARERLKR